jgi:TPR repeat protein
MTANPTVTFHVRGTALAVAALLCGACSTARPFQRQGPAPREAAGACGSATLGIETVDASRALRRTHGLPEDLHGAMVVEVLAGGPAAQAGLDRWDVVEGLTAKSIHEVRSSADLDAAMEEVGCGPGDSVQVTIRRGHQRLTESIRPVEALPFYAEACAKGLPTGCFQQGLATAGQAGIARDDHRAEELFDRACALGSGAACRELAQRRGAPWPAAERHRLLERSCALHYATGCVDLAFLYATGRDGVTRDDARATPLFVEACDGGEPAGCYNVGLMYQDGRGVSADLAVAVAAYEDGCLGGSSPACDNLGTLYDQGRGVAASPEKAVALYQRACKGSFWDSGNADGCANLGRMYRDGKGVEKNPSRAVELFREVCDRSPDDPDDVNTLPAAANACSLLGAQYAKGSGVAADPGLAILRSRQGCDGGDAFGCYNLGVLYMNGEGVAADDAAALASFKRACDAGDAEGCFEVGWLYAEGRGAPRSERQAATFYERACEARSGEACANLAVLSASEIPPDVTRAVALFARGCDLGEPIACFDLANHYADGTGVEQDTERAAALYAQACSGGYPAACAKAKAPPPRS